MIGFFKKYEEIVKDGLNAVTKYIKASEIFKEDCGEEESEEEIYISVPFNTQGTSEIYQLLSILPENITKYIELYAEDLTVGINVKAEEVQFIGVQTPIKYMCNTLINLDKESLFVLIEGYIKENELSNSCQNGYEYYKSDSRKGLGKYNKAKYEEMRATINRV